MKLLRLLTGRREFTPEYTAFVLDYIKQHDSLTNVQKEDYIKHIKKLYKIDNKKEWSD